MESTPLALHGIAVGVYHLAYGEYIIAIFSNAFSVFSHFQSKTAIE